MLDLNKAKVHPVFHPDCSLSFLSLSHHSHRFHICDLIYSGLKFKNTPQETALNICSIFVIIP